MAKLPDLKMYVFMTPEDIKPAKKAGMYNLRVRMGHNHDDVNQVIPTKVFVQDTPVGMINVTSDVTETFRNVRLDLLNPITVRIVRAGLKNSEGEVIEVPSEMVQTPPAAANVKPLKPDLEVPNPPRDPDSSNGMFLVPVQVHKDGTLTITSTPTRVDLKRHTAGGLTDFPSPVKVVVGFYEIYVGFVGPQVTLKLQMDHGNPVEFLLRK